MDVDPTQPASPECAIFYHEENLPISCNARVRKGVEIRENVRPVLQVAAGQFTSHAGMHQHTSFGKEASEFRPSVAEVFNPHRSIGNPHQAGRRRGTSDNLG